MKTVLFYADGCHDFLEQTTPENRAELNRLLTEYKKVKIERGDVELPFEVHFAELSIDKQNKVRLKRLRQDERGQEKRDMQRIKKFYEDR